MLQTTVKGPEIITADSKVAAGAVHSLLGGGELMEKKGMGWRRNQASGWAL